MSNSYSQNSPRRELEGNHHLLPHSILCTSPQGPHPNGFLSRNSQVGVPKFPQLRLHRLWGPIISPVDLWLQWSLKQSCSPCRELSNGILQAAYMQGNQVDSWLLVVESQTVSLTPGLSFDHNLCSRCPNEWCEPSLNIYTSIAFQWYKKLFQPMGFGPCYCVLKIQESIWDYNSHNGSSFGRVRVHPLTLLALLWTCDVTLGSPSWLATLQPLALVASPKLGLQHHHIVVVIDVWIIDETFDFSFEWY
jgi:hypothetical protein